MLVGSNISLNCHTEYVLNGPNTSTCLENGEWVPDPKEAQCEGMYTCKNHYDYDLIKVLIFQWTVVHLSLPKMV